MSSSAPWPIELIPDDDYVFYRVAVGGLRADRKPHPLVFKENRGSMSVDWEKYSTAEQTRSRPGRPERFAVLRLPANGIRKIKRLTLTHDPIYLPDNVPPLINRAHSGIVGIEIPSDVAEIGYKERVQIALLELTGSMWEIPPSDMTANTRIGK